MASRSWRGVLGVIKLFHRKTNIPPFSHKAITRIFFVHQTTWAVKANHAGMLFWHFLSPREVGIRFLTIW